MAERFAERHLKRHGLRLICRNFSCRVGEVDLVMQHHSPIQPKLLVFVEVRYRNQQSFGGAAASVSFSKQQKLARTAAYFRQRNPMYADWPIRFDVVALQGSLKNLDITWLPRAFEC